MSDQFSYIKFPFGILDYDRLQKLQEYHEQKLRQKLEGEEREWLKGCESLCSTIGIDIAKIKQFLRHKYGISLTNESVGEILWENVRFQMTSGCLALNHETQM